MNLMKCRLSILLVICWVSGFSQFNWVEIGVDGLTCSQCTRSVEMEIKKLLFVKDIKMDLEHTKGRITFKDGTKVYIEKIAKAVEAAGFSVRYLKADFTFNNLNINDGECFPFENRAYQFVRTGAKSLKGETQIKFIGKDYMPKKEYRSWQPELKSNCSDKEKIFYVTLV